MRSGFLTGSPFTWGPLAGSPFGQSSVVIVDTHDGAAPRKKQRKERKPLEFVATPVEPSAPVAKKPTLETYVPETRELVEFAREEARAETDRVVRAANRALEDKRREAERLRKLRDEEDAAFLLLLM
jgi:hypothetical protein